MDPMTSGRNDRWPELMFQADILPLESDPMLRIHQPESPALIPLGTSSAAAGPASYTLREAFELGKWPELVDAGRNSIATRRGYNTHICRWENWAESNRSYRPMLTKGPPIGEITSDDLHAFRRWLVETALTGSNVRHNANKHVKSVTAILKWAARRGHIGAVPAIVQLDADTVGPKLFYTYDQASALYVAAAGATWPTVDDRLCPLPFSAPVYWRFLIVWLFNYGFRTQEIASYEREHTALKWKNVTTSAECLDPAAEETNQSGWLRYVPQKQRVAKPQPLTLPLNVCTAWHLETIRPPADADRQPDRPLLPWPRCGRSLYGQWHALTEAAGVKPRRDPLRDAADRYQLEHFRKTCTTWANRHRPGIARWITGHAPRDVSDKHYHNPLPDLVEALTTLPQPAAFTSGLG